MALSTRHLLDALRLAGLWLVAVSVLLGPLGFGASTASAAMKTCGVSCPCDEAQHAEEAAHDHGPCDDADSDAHHEEAPCDDECPDDCPECTCCPGLTVGLAPGVIPGLPGTSSSSELVAPPDTAASGDISGIFRPPRALA